MNLFFKTLKQVLIIKGTKMPGITCLACNVGFEDVDLGRIHYKTDWHRYNLKRKVASLPPVTLEKFEERQKAQEQLDATTKSERCACKPCNKWFNTTNSYENHLQSKKHRDVISGVEKIKKDKKRTESKSSTASSISVAQLSNKKNDMSEDEDDSDVESLDSYDESIIALEECLFCSLVSPSMENNLTHMTSSHGFFLPDAEYICDLEGLMTYLGEKVGAGSVCLWCNEKGKRFRNSKDVQKHMVDMGHCKIFHEQETLYEFTDFYDYSKSYPNNEGEDPDADLIENVDIMELDGDGYSLTLPSGNVIGHRSLMRYYRQNLGPYRHEKTKTILPKMLAHYKALGWTGATGPLVERRAKDLQYMQRVRNRHFMKLGTKGNNLRLRLRRQNPI